MTHHETEKQRENDVLTLGIIFEPLAMKRTEKAEKLLVHSAPAATSPAVAHQHLHRM